VIANAFFEQIRTLPLPLFHSDYFHDTLNQVSRENLFNIGYRFDSYLHKIFLIRISRFILMKKTGMANSGIKAYIGTTIFPQYFVQKNE